MSRSFELAQSNVAIRTGPDAGPCVALRALQSCRAQLVLGTTQKLENDSCEHCVQMLGKTLTPEWRQRFTSQVIGRWQTNWATECSAAATNSSAQFRPCSDSVRIPAIAASSNRVRKQSNSKECIAWLRICRARPAHSHDTQYAGLGVHVSMCRCNSDAYVSRQRLGCYR